MDIKAARRAANGRQTQSRITLYTGNTYFKWPGLHWPGTFRPFSDYATHLDVLMIYTLNPDSNARVEDLEIIVQEPWRIASRDRSSTTREYLGAITASTRFAPARLPSRLQRSSTTTGGSSPSRSALRCSPAPATPQATQDELAELRRARQDRNRVSDFRTASRVPGSELLPVCHQQQGGSSTVRPKASRSPCSPAQAAWTSAPNKPAMRFAQRWSGTATQQPRWRRTSITSSPRSSRTTSWRRRLARSCAPPACRRSSGRICCRRPALHAVLQVGLLAGMETRGPRP